MADLDIVDVRPLAPQRLPPGAPPGAGGGPMTQPQVTVYPEPRPDPRSQAIDFWRTQGGVPQHVAEGIADNISRESGFDPLASGDGGTSAGLYQAHADRRSDLTADPNWRDPMRQHQWALSQVQGGDPTATQHWNEIKSAKSREEARDLFKRYFERPAESSLSIVGVGNNRVSDRAIAAGQGVSTATVRYANVDDLLSMVEPREDTASEGRKLQAVRDSLSGGDEIETLPRIDVERKGDRLKITDWDMRNRLQALKEQGVTSVPVMFAGAGPAEGVKNIEDVHGKVRPFDFPLVPKVERDPGMAEKFASGVRSTLVEGPTQLASHLLPTAVTRAITNLNNMLADRGAPLGRIPEGGIDEYERQRQAELERTRTADSLPYTLGEIVGATAPAIAAAGVGAPATLLGSLARGAAEGAIGAATEPVTSGDNFWWEKGGQAAMGAGVGAGVGAAGRAIGGAIMPTLRPNAQKLVDEGVRLTPGQAAGGTARRIEDSLSSVPVLGSAIRGGQRRAVEDFNRAAWNRVLEPLGMSLPRNVGVGREAANYVEDVLNRGYDRIVPRLRGQADMQFLRELRDVAQRASAQLPDPQFSQLSKIIRSQLLQKVSAPADGRALHGIDVALKEYARGYRSDPSFDNRQLGHLIQDLQTAFRSTLERQNPQYAPQLKALDNAWANFVRVDRASASVGANEGVFTPAQLSTAVRAEDKSLKKRGYAKGQALLQDLSDAAKDVLPRRVPDSGTPERLLLAGAIEGHFSPHVLAGSLAASAPYTAAGMNALRTWMTALPKTRSVLSQVPRQATPWITPGSPFLMQPGVGQTNR